MNEDRPQTGNSQESQPVLPETPDPVVISSGEALESSSQTNGQPVQEASQENTADTVPAPSVQPALPVFEPKKAPFFADAADIVFALFSIPLGYLFTRWILFQKDNAAWFTGVFGLLYAGGVLFYMIKKKFALTKASLFWYAGTVAASVSCILYEQETLEDWRFLYLLFSYVYFIVTVTNERRNGAILDTLNALVFAPFANFFNIFRTYPAREEGKVPPAIVALGGIAAGGAVLAIVSPLLLRADTGRFEEIIGSLISIDELAILILSVPVIIFQFALVSGFAHHRKTDVISKDRDPAREDAKKRAPAVFFLIIIVMLIIYYGIFFASQIPAFLDRSYVSIAGYARGGFFELSSISIINFLLLAASSFFCGKDKNTLSMKAAGTLLCLETLAFISLASLKMGLYVDSYGLTDLRLYPMIFMAFLAVVFILHIIGLYRPLKIYACSIALASVVMAVLLLVNPEPFILRYNAGRYLNGTLSEFDIDILNRMGYAGLPAAEALAPALPQEKAEDLKRYVVNLYKYNVPSSIEGFRNRNNGRSLYELLDKKND